MKQLVLSFLVIWTALCCVHASLIRSKRDISVQIGRSVFIAPDDLVIDGGTTCKVELDVFDPISQSVGTLEPKAFDCRFPAKSVKYIHNGSPLLKQDRIKLRVHKFSNREIQTEIIYLKINILNEAYDVFVSGNPKPLTVDTFNGYSNPIDASILRFRYDMRNNATCMVGFSHYGTNWPLAGQLVMGPDNTPVDALWRECHEFLFLGLRYQHLLPPTPDTDYIPLKVQVNDPFKGIIIERLYLPIKVTGAFPNIPPKAAFMKAYLMDVDQFVLTIVSPNVMGAEDDETPEPQLVYNISRPLGPNEGYFVNLADHTRPITSFLQADLSNLNIAYQPPNISYPDRTDFSIEFVIFDSHFTPSTQPIVLHISIRPSETVAPRVALNSGLTLIEGHSATIMPHNLQIVDKDNIDRVHCLVKAGLLHGDILVNGRKQMSFSPHDIALGRVVYYHDDTDTSRDQVRLRISDGLHSIQTTLFIHIIPKDDSPPALVNNIDLDVAQGEQVQIKEQNLSAHDSDSNDYDIIYKITSAPARGELKRKISAGSAGHIASKFTEEELMKGFIYYEQHKQTNSVSDSFKFTLLDQNQPPNESGEHVVMIHIHPQKNFPPRKIQSTEGSITTKESDVVYIDKYHLGFEDPDSEDDEIIYTITAQPYFVGSEETLDAGRIISTRNLTMVMKSPSIPAIMNFTQAEINHMKIAYMPPMEDIGPDPKQVRFHYTVSDTTENVLTGLTFQITLVPVNDQIPQLLIKPLNVQEGQSTALTSEEMFIQDRDTKTEELELTFDAMPSRGLLKKDGVIMSVGNKFAVSDLKRKKIRYYHDGSDDTTDDSFGVTVSDGMYRLSKAIPIHIHLLDDQLPSLTEQSSSKLVVTEGGDAMITSAVLTAEDKDTTANKITYIIVQPPTKGSVVKGRQSVNRFTQEEVNADSIMYTHRSGEIGYNSDIDSFKFIIADRVLTSMQDVSIYQMNITIHPLNNRSPKVVLGNPLIVKEGGQAEITFDILGAQDADSKPEDLVFLIQKQPEWGYVENVRPSPGSEKSNAGKSIEKFTLSDVRDGKINYVQADHNEIEPTSDQIVVKVTDGELSSRETVLKISIIPQNDEKPIIEMTDIVIEEGQEKPIDDSIMTIKDLDYPADRLMVSVFQEPAHGKIKMMIERKQRGGEEMVEIPLHDFPATDMQEDTRLYYKHDGTESTNDEFVIKVSDGHHVVRRMAKVHVKKMNDESPQIIKNAGLRILYGEAAFISKAVLKAVDVDNKANDITYVLVRKPQRGVLQVRTRSLFAQADSKDVDDLDTEWEEIAENMNFTQQQVDNNDVRYTHTGDMGEMQADSFKFKVTDGDHTSPEETFEIEIEHSQVSEIALLARGIKVKEGQRVYISTETLSAEDGTDRFNRIYFTIFHPPLFGQLESLDRPGETLKYFTQMDLAARKIVYIHTSRSDSVEDWFRFTVSNGFQSKNGTLFIHIIPTDRITPTLQKNNVLFIKRGTERPISSTYLHVADPDTKSTNLTYFIMKAPDHGQLLNKGIKIIQKFTQDDINTDRITYESFGGKAENDYFWFAVTDNKHIGFLVNGSLHLDPVKFTIALITIDPTPPILVRNRQPTMLDSFERKRIGYIISSRLLKVTSSHESSNKLTFLIMQRPKFGHLEDMTSKKVFRRKFTQADIDSGNMAYIIDTKNKSMTSDSFVFKVMDSKRNELNPKRFYMAWPMIEFTRLEYIVCEDVGTLSVGLRRIGETVQSSYISVSVKEMSAKAGEDFGSQTAAQIQFDPGVKMVMWDIAIRDDGLPEGKEMFKLLLRNPVNAVVGNYEKATIKIVNKNNAKRKCIEVPGMIHKGGIITSPNSGYKPSSVMKTDKERVYTFHGISRVKSEPRTDYRDKDDYDDYDEKELGLDPSGNMKPLNDGTPTGGGTSPRAMKNTKTQSPKRRGRKKKNKKNMTRKQKKIARFWERRDKMKKKMQKKMKKKGERQAMKHRKKDTEVEEEEEEEEEVTTRVRGSRRQEVARQRQEKPSRRRKGKRRRQERPSSSSEASWMYNNGKGGKGNNRGKGNSQGPKRQDASRQSHSQQQSYKGSYSSPSRPQAGSSRVTSGKETWDDFKMKEVFNSMDGRVVSAGEVGTSDEGGKSRKRGRKNRRRKKNKGKKKGDEGEVDLDRGGVQVVEGKYGPSEDNEGEDLDIAKISGQSGKKRKNDRKGKGEDREKEKFKQKMKERKRKLKEKKKRERLRKMKEKERLRKEKQRKKEGEKERMGKKSEGEESDFFVEETDVRGESIDLNRGRIHESEDMNSGTQENDRNGGKVEVTTQMNRGVIGENRDTIFENEEERGENTEDEKQTRKKNKRKKKKKNRRKNSERRVEERVEGDSLGVVESGGKQGYKDDKSSEEKPVILIPIIEMDERHPITEATPRPREPSTPGKELPDVGSTVAATTELSRGSTTQLPQLSSPIAELASTLPSDIVTDSYTEIPVTDDRMSVDMPAVDNPRPRLLSDDGMVKKPGSYGYLNSRLPDDIERGLKGREVIDEEGESSGDDDDDDEDDGTVGIQYVNDCTPATKGMLHLDPATSLIYKCDGYDWLSLEDEFRAAQTTTPPTTTTAKTLELIRRVRPTSECLPGWMKSNGRCYKVFSDTLSWDMAQKTCRMYGADLPSVWALQQLDWIWQLNSKESFWLGLNCKRKFKHWEYSNGDPVTFTYWRMGYPRGGPRSKKDCVLVRSDKLWSNRPCDSVVARFVCSKLPLSIHRTIN